MAEFDGMDRRNNRSDSGNDKLILYRIDKIEKDIETFGVKQNAMILDMTTLKSELQHSARTEANSSSIKTSITIGIIMLFINAIWKIGTNG
jgi:hypothetical protein